MNSTGSLIYIVFLVPLQIYINGTVYYYYYPLNVMEGDGRMQVCLQIWVVTESLHILVETTHTNTADTTPAIGKPVILEAQFTTMHLLVKRSMYVYCFGYCKY